MNPKEAYKNRTDEEKSAIGYILSLPKAIKDVSTTMKEYDGIKTKKVIVARKHAAHFLLLAEEIEKRTRAFRVRYFAEKTTLAPVNRPVVMIISEIQERGGKDAAEGMEFENIAYSTASVLKRLHHKYMKAMMVLK